MFKKPVSQARNADWISELPSLIKHYNNAIHSSSKMTPVEASKNVNEKIVFTNLQDKRREHEPKCKIGHIVRTVEVKKHSLKAHSSDWSYKLTAKTNPTQHVELTIHAKFTKKNLLRSTNIVHDEKALMMIELNLSE